MTRKEKKNVLMSRRTGSFCEHNNIMYTAGGYGTDRPAFCTADIIMIRRIMRILPAGPKSSDRADLGHKIKNENDLTKGRPRTRFIDLSTHVLIYGSSSGRRQFHILFGPSEKGSPDINIITLIWVSLRT